jgi:hypothetical protein
MHRHRQSARHGDGHLRGARCGRHARRRGAKGSARDVGWGLLSGDWPALRANFAALAKRWPLKPAAKKPRRV